MNAPARQKVGAAAKSGVEMCSVRVGETTFGVPIMRILEILGGSPTQAVPLAPPYIGGLAHYRGEVLTAVSLRSLLDLPPRDGPSDILVFENDDGYFGLIVDEVGEVMTVLPEAFEANPSTLNDRRKALFAGTCKIEGRLAGGSGSRSARPDAAFAVRPTCRSTSNHYKPTGPSITSRSQSYPKMQAAVFCSSGR